MATVSAEPATLVGRPEGAPFRLSAVAYFQMIDAEIIAPERRVGLWEGRLYEKMAKKLAHSVAGTLVGMTLTRTLPEEWSLWIESPILVDDFTAPLPDFAVVKGVPHVYSRRGSVPRAEEIGLVVEIADGSLRKNLTETLRVYARAGLPCYWVVNLVARRVEVYSGPRVEGDVARYEVSAMFEAGKDVPLVLDGREVARIPAQNLLPEEAV